MYLGGNNWSQLAREASSFSQLAPRELAMIKLKFLNKMLLVEGSICLTSLASIFQAPELPDKIHSCSAVEPIDQVIVIGRPRHYLHQWSSISNPFLALGSHLGCCLADRLSRA